MIFLIAYTRGCNKNEIEEVFRIWLPDYRDERDGHGGFKIHAWFCFLAVADIFFNESHEEILVGLNYINAHFKDKIFDRKGTCPLYSHLSTGFSIWFLAYFFL